MRLKPIIIILIILAGITSCKIKSSTDKKGYFVDAALGDDANSGTSPTSAWKSIERANLVRLKPGDKLLFAGGQSYFGTLVFKGLKGSKDQNITISSYGNGRALIDGGTHNGLLLDSCIYLQVKNINVKGSGRLSGNNGSGIECVHNENLSIDSIESSGFIWSGIKILGGKSIRITNVYAHDNGFSGINAESDGKDCGGLKGSGAKSLHDLYIGYCIAENNPGCPKVKNNHSGNGILIGGVTKGIIEHCEALKNGWDMPRGGNGPVGIWAYQCDSVIISYCFSHHNKTSATGKDGGGFDFDGGVTNSILQYNLSLENEGSGIGLFQYGGATLWKNNIVRYNICINDGSKNGKAGILLWCDPSANNMSDCRIYNNTIVNNQGFGVNHEPGNYKGFIFENNIFYMAVKTTRFLGGSFSGAQYDNNLYWTVNKEDKFPKQPLEKIDAHGIREDPLLKLPVDLNQLIPDSRNPQFLRDMVIIPSSPCVRAGKVITNNGGKDFWGNPVSVNDRPDIGAHQLTEQGK